MSSMTGSRSGYDFGSNKNPKVAGYNAAQYSKYSPEMMKVIQSLMGRSMPGMEGSIDQLSEMAGGGTPEMWAQLEAPAMRQFAGLQGNMASRFSGMGMGARRSSGFQNTMGSAGADLAERLQSQRMGLQRDARRDLMSMMQDLMGRQEKENVMQKAPWLTILEALISAGGQAAAAAAGGGG